MWVRKPGLLVLVRMVEGRPIRVKERLDGFRNPNVSTLRWKHMVRESDLSARRILEVLWFTAENPQVSSRRCFIEVTPEFSPTFGFCAFWLILSELEGTWIGWCSELNSFGHISLHLRVIGGHRRQPPGRLALALFPKYHSGFIKCSRHFQAQKNSKTPKCHSN